MKKIDARKLSTEVQQHNRDMAIRLYQEGHTQTSIAATLSVHYITVNQWIAAFKKHGMDGIKIRKRGRPSGQQRKLTAAQEQALKQKLIDKSPHQLKLDFALWTSRAIRALIWDMWHIQVAARTIRTYMRQWGFTPQKPLKRAYQRDPKKVQQWLDNDYPKIKAQAQKEQATIFWADETGITNQSHHGRGYAPKGQTPVLEHDAARYRVNMISALDNRGQVRFMLYRDTLTARVFIRFLRRLIKDTERKVIVILDNLRVHHARLVRQWVQKNGNKIALHYLPAYSPDLNPDEYLNGDLKSQIRNTTPARNQSEMVKIVRGHMKMLQANPERVQRYFHHSAIRYAA